jgi:alpha-tubulin suppressor-like RCC1 family protein
MRRVGSAFAMLVLIGGVGASGLGSAGAASSHPAGVYRGRPAIAAGLEDACGLSSSGSLKCWGSNQYFVLGTAQPPRSPIALTVPGIANATAIAVGLGACALFAPGTVKCWGYPYPTKPTLVKGVTSAVAISMQSHTCIALRSGTVQCWGNGTDGALGNGATANSVAPVTVKGVTNAVAVSTGSNWSCAVLKDGSARCWGGNQYGALGSGTSVDRSLTPVRVKGLSGAVAIASGNGSSCALLGTGHVECWGDNIAGQLGNGTKSNGGSRVPVKVKKLDNAVSISVGSGFACSALANGRAKCWGSNSFKTVGDGKDFSVTTPDFVTNISNAKTVATGAISACALLADGTVRCWGSNQKGELGTGTAFKDSAKPLLVKGLNLGRHA